MRESDAYRSSTRIRGAQTRTRPSTPEGALRRGSTTGTAAAFARRLGPGVLAAQLRLAICVEGLAAGARHGAAPIVTRAVTPENNDRCGGARSWNRPPTQFRPRARMRGPGIWRRRRPDKRQAVDAVTTIPAALAPGGIVCSLRAQRLIGPAKLKDHGMRAARADGIVLAARVSFGAAFVSRRRLGSPGAADAQRRPDPTAAGYDESSCIAAISSALFDQSCYSVHLVGLSAPIWRACRSGARRLQLKRRAASVLFSTTLQGFGERNGGTCRESRTPSDAGTVARQFPRDSQAAG